MTTREDDVASRQMICALVTLSTVSMGASRQAWPRPDDYKKQNVVGHITAEIRDEKSVGKYLLISWAIVSAHESNRALLYKILVAWQALAMEE